MTLAVTIEPTTTGFRASCSSVQLFEAEAATAEDALAQLQLKTDSQLNVKALKPRKKFDLTEATRLADELRNSAGFDELETAILEYRQEHNIKPIPE